MSTVLTIIKKEFRRFFGDLRLFLMTILLPGFLIYAVYSVIGNVTTSIMASEMQTPQICVVNMPASMENLIASPAFRLIEDVPEEQQAKEMVASGELDLYVVFPADFDEKVLGDDHTQVPNVIVFYNSAETQSATAYTTFSAILSAYEESLSNLFDVNNGVNGDLADSTSVALQVVSSIVPMVLIMLMFSGCVSVVLESIAGEKERGTIATLLVTPIKRSHLAAGKIIALSVISMLSGISSFIGLMLSLPNLLSGVSGLTISLYAFTDYLLIFLVVISTVLVLVSLLAVISAYSKTVKEANSLIVPVMVLVMVCALVSMFVPSASVGLYFVPVLNSSLCISSVLSGTMSALSFGITVAVNIVAAGLLAVLLAVMFNSEKIMFNR